jgi:uncharacterized protein (DUF305 family)
MSIAGMVILGACGSSSSSSNDSDVMFSQMMIPHHEQAIELSDLALNPAAGASDPIRELAMQIKNAQDPEITFMKNWLTEMKMPLVADEGVDHSSMMSGMLSLEDLDAMRTLTGAEFDQAWIASMIAHHEGAIDMARTVLSDGQDKDIATLAEEIIQAQAAEIEALRLLAAPA